jgi:SAM-dependent methyltransferase
MNKEYVQQYATLEKEHWWFVVRQKIILHFLKKHIKNAPVKILNIGAAAGASTKLLTNFGKVVSVETELYFINHLKHENIDVVDASITAMPFADASFDVVCAFDVIEHIENDEAAIKEMERVCKPCGIVFVTVPTFNFLWSKHDVVNKHVRRYTKNSLSVLISKAKTLQKIDGSYFNFLLFLPIAILRLVSNLFVNKNDVLQSDFTYFSKIGFLNSFLKFLFSLEIPLLKFMRFPFGVSLISVWKKQAEDTEKE